MQPYQRAAEARRSGEEYPLQILKNAGLTAIGGGLASIGSKAANKLIPAIGSLINNYIPEDISMKGLSKIDPRFGNFIKGAMEEGYSYDDIREFLGEKINKQENSSQSNPLQDFETTYPNIANALARTMENGQAPDAAAAILKNSSSFSKDIKNIEKETGKNFIDYVLEIFGNQAGQMQSQQMQQQPQQMQQTEMMQQMGGQQQQGNGLDSQLMAALDKILKM